MSDKNTKSKEEKTGSERVELEKHEPPHTTKPFPAPKFGSAGSGGAEFERLPEQHEDEKTPE